MCLQHVWRASVIHTGREKCATQCRDKWKWQVAMEVSTGCDTEIQHEKTRADLPSLERYLSPSSTAPWNLSFSSLLSQINSSPFQFATVHRILSQRAKNDLISKITGHFSETYHPATSVCCLHVLASRKWSCEVFLRDSEVKVAVERSAFGSLFAGLQDIFCETFELPFIHCNILFSIM